ILDAMMECQSEIDFTSHQIRAVTTQAMRKASNADEILLKIKEKTGVMFEVISGEQEATFTLLGVKHRMACLDKSVDNFVLVDIGGGSTELVFVYDNEVMIQSFPVGIVTMVQRYPSLLEMKNVLIQEMKEIASFCQDMYRKKGKINHFLATAGTPTTVASMKIGQCYETYDSAKINGTFLAVDELDFYLQTLLDMPFEEREKCVGTGRSDLIAAGILIYKQLFVILEHHQCMVVDDGLREGVAIDYCHKMGY
ncbi:MAG: hypothetical protein RL113_1481, partial [Pseudomonadota bacterium]